MSCGRLGLAKAVLGRRGWSDTDGISILAGLSQGERKDGSPDDQHQHKL